MKKKSFQKILRLIILLVIFLGSGYALLVYSLRSPNLDKVTHKLGKEVALFYNRYYQKGEREILLEKIYPSPIDFTKLWERNKDIYAYIKIPGTKVDYPILRSNEKDEDYYLDVTPDNIHGLPGSIYTQMVNDPRFEDPLTIIYGHDMLDGSCFGGLQEYIDEKYMEEHKEIGIYLPDKVLRYEVLGEVVFDDRLLPAAYDVHSIDGMKAFMEDAYASLESENRWRDKTEIKTTDKILVLSTCIGPRPTHRRLIIARRVSSF